jgi:serine protease
MNKKGRLVIALCVFIVAATALPMLPVWRQSAPEPVPAAADAGGSGSLVVDLRDDATTADIQDLDARYHLDLEPNSPEAVDDKLMLAAVAPSTNTGQLLAQLRADPRVEAAEPEILYSLPDKEAEQEHPLANAANDGAVPQAVPGPAEALRQPEPRGGKGFTPNDPRYSEQWNLQMIGAPIAWQRSRGKGVVVAVIDTGVAARRTKRGNQAKDFDQTRFVAGYDFVHHDKDPYDDHGHGTHVAGTIAESTNNGEGVAGLAFDAKIMPLKVLNQMGFGNSGDIADAIRYAADHKANVINMSLGSYFSSRVIHNAVRYAAKKGVVIVCAAGNGFGRRVGYPAAYKECIAVSAVGPTGEIATYSSYGKEVTLAAPGGDMLRSRNPQDGILQNTIIPEEAGGTGDDYYYFNGTSMASPHVAAAAALLMAQGVEDPAKVRETLIDSATPKDPELKYGAGILNVDKATAAVVHRMWLEWIKRIILLLLSILLPFSLRGAGFGFRLALGIALLAGGLGPDALAWQAGANSAWNLIAFSALIPFLLFWEFETGRGSQWVGFLALGTTFCLGWGLFAHSLPWTATVFGTTPLPWTIANLLLALLLGGVALIRASARTE